MSLSMRDMISSIQLRDRMEIEMLTEAVIVKRNYSVDVAKDGMESVSGEGYMRA